MHVLKTLAVSEHARWLWKLGQQPTSRSNSRGVIK
jgi:hypothetical protein